ncbi:MAG: DUF2147 domain-containing protein [Shimia thalassica]|uniref:DUF2147 domain-containing protein n=1 Tax=Shimia thalassica TaxID=1715693 RepID=UPI0032971DB6
MKTALRSVAIAATILTAGLAQADILGTWRTEPSDGATLDVKIAACGDALCGHVVDVNGGADASLIGTQIIKGMTGSDAAGYSGGQIFAPDTGKWYRSKISRSGNNISVSGCVAGGLICRSQIWTTR